MAYIHRRGGIFSARTSAQLPPFEGGFKGDVLFGIMVCPTTENNHSKENIPLAPFKGGGWRNDTGRKIFCPYGG